MWITPFEEELLTPDSLVVVNCPTRDLERDMADLLQSLGYSYPGEQSLLAHNAWDRYHEDFCYFIECCKKKVLRGPKEDADRGTYNKYMKCTFYGSNNSFEVDDKQSIEAFLGL